MATGTVDDCMCWHVAAWPAADQQAWHRNIAPTDPFGDEAHHGATLRPATLLKVRKGYGRWLSFLASRGQLDIEIPPLERVSVPRLRAYCRTLLRAGNAPSTVIGRFADLTMAMKILAPGHDVRWIARPDGISIYTLLPKIQKPVRVPACEVLYDWGLRMMDTAGRLADPKAQAMAYRDGLLIALLAARGRRRLSMSYLTVRTEFFRDGDHYRVEFTRDQIKTKKPERFDVSVALTPYIDHYLAVSRPILLQGQCHASLWVGQSGRPLTSKGIAERLRVLSLKQFAYSFGSHAFRHALSTMLAEYDPGTPGLAADVLGISPEVESRHYNRAKQIRASETYAMLVDRKRREAAQCRQPTRKMPVAARCPVKNR